MTAVTNTSGRSKNIKSISVTVKLAVMTCEAHPTASSILQIYKHVVMFLHNNHYKYFKKVIRAL